MFSSKGKKKIWVGDYLQHNFILFWHFINITVMKKASTLEQYLFYKNETIKS